MNKEVRYLVLTLALLIVASTHTVSAHTLNPAFIEKITGQHSEQHLTDQKTDPRFEERTFASFPEWYIVYNAQEYSEFVSRGGRPSQFPYFASSNQYWDSVGYVRTALGSSTIDSNTNTVLRVIGASFTVENTIIGAYEKTIGFAFETVNFFVKTNEDRYTEEVAAEYGQFLLHTPWYEFPYGHKLFGLWTNYGWSSLTPRGIERRIAFTVGYTIKGIYGVVLGKLSGASLGKAQLTTSATLKNISANQLEKIVGVTVVEAKDGYVHIIAPRYRAFSAIASALAEQGGIFVDIEGNDTIMITVFAEKNTTCLSSVTVQFSMPLLTQPTLSRIAISTEVAKLSEIIRDLKSCGISMEHIYDY